MERGGQTADSGLWRDRWVRSARCCALSITLFCACAGMPARGEALSDYDRFAKIGGPISENIDINKIKALLRQAKGLSLVDKLEMRRHLTAFTEEFYKFHKGVSDKTLAHLRAQFDALHRKIMSLLSPENPQLSAHFERARGALWSAYSDHEAFTSTVGREIVKDIECEGAGLVGQRYEVAPMDPSGRSLRPPAK